MTTTLSTIVARCARGLELSGLIQENIPRRLILPQANELRMSQVVVGRAFEELELADELRLQPLALGQQ